MILQENMNRSLDCSPNSHSPNKSSRLQSSLLKGDSNFHGVASKYLDSTSLE